MEYLLILFFSILIWLIGSIFVSSTHNSQLTAITDYVNKDKKIDLPRIELDDMHSKVFWGTVISSILCVGLCLTIFLVNKSDAYKIKQYDALITDIRKDAQLQAKYDIYDELKKELNK